MNPYKSPTAVDDEKPAGFWPLRAIGVAVFFGNPVFVVHHVLSNGGDLYQAGQVAVGILAVQITAICAVALWRLGGAQVVVAVTMLLAPTLSLAEQPTAGILPAGEIREAIQELREHRAALREQASESRAWRVLLDRIEARFSAWDGSALRAFFAAIWSPIATAAAAVYRLAWGLIAAVIAVCIARTVREVSEAVVAWRARA